VEVGRPIRVLLLLLAVLAPVWAQAQTAGQGQTPTRQIELYPHHTRDVAVDGVTSAVTLDENVCRVQIDSGVLHITGMETGQSAVLVWAGDRRLNLLVNVVEEPRVLPPPTLQGFTTFGAGSVRTYATTNWAGNSRTLSLVNQFDWTQNAGPSRELHIMGMFTDETIAGGHGFNLGAVTVAYTTPHWDLAAGDFGLFINANPVGAEASFVPVQGLTLRGVDLRLRKGQNAFEWFGGAGIPGYYLTYSRVREAAGMRWTHTVSPRLQFFTTAFFSRTYNAFDLTDPTVHNDLTSIVGVNWRPTANIEVIANGGGGTGSREAAATIAYHGSNYELFGGFSSTSPNGTFANLRVSSLPGTNLEAGGTFRASRRLQFSGSVQRSLSRTMPTVTGSVHESASTTANANMSYDFHREHSLSVSYNFMGATSFGDISEGSIQRVDATLRSFIGQNVANAATVSLYKYGASKTGFDEHTDLSVQDSVRWQAHHGLAMIGSVSYGRTGMPLIDRLREELWMLDAAQQALFEQNPAAFLSTVQLSPALQAALDSLQTSHVVLMTGVEFSRNRFQITPTLRISLNDGSSGSTTYQFGFTASYLLGSYVLQSSLTHQYYLMPSSAKIQRSTQFTFGIVKRLNSNPFQWISQTVVRGRIRGRVFVDQRIRGLNDPQDPGLRGIRVVLDDGREVKTDANGDFQFSGLEARIYTVTVPLDQFPTPVRMTTPSPIRVNLTQHRTAEVPFGVVNFARVLGVAFNDYMMQGLRAPDAPGIGGLKLTLHQAPDRTLTTACESGGDYEFSNLEPGQYTVEVDPASLPANYELVSRTFDISVQPASSFVLDVPVRAIRTISGVLLFQEHSGTAEAPRPIANAAVEAGGQRTHTAADGTFLLRNLPAGEMTLRILPNGSDLPHGVQPPAARLRLTREPQQVEGVRIVITNPELLNYLLKDDRIARR